MTLIAGPTASGKSAYALDMALRTGATIVNADSMQVYSILRVITARPSEADLALAPHRLYGHVHPSTPYSTGEWLREVSALLDEDEVSGPLIFVGGTGLYFKALLGGLADIPAVDPDVRAKWRQRLIGEGAAVLHSELARRDPEGAAALRPTDGQRIARALEVIDSTGRPLKFWRDQPGLAIVDPDRTRRIVLEPDRDVLRARIAARFDRMIDEGALEEVNHLLKLDLDPALPARKAIGVPELEKLIAGTLSRENAVEKAKIATMQYAKRQRTWFRNQFNDRWHRVFS